MPSQKVTVDELKTAIITSAGPQSQATQAEYVKFHDDKVDMLKQLCNRAVAYSDTHELMEGTIGKVKVLYCLGAVDIHRRLRSGRPHKCGRGPRPPVALRC